MNKKIVERILDVQESLRSDPVYQALVAEHEALNARFLETVNALEESQRDTVFDYLGLILEMHTRLLERAVM